MTMRPKPTLLALVLTNVYPSEYGSKGAFE